MKVCSEPGCPNLTHSNRCPTHTPTRQQRGYDKTHDRTRRNYAIRMARGERFTCWRCGQPITPTQPWDTGHDDHDRSIYRGPEHVACNRATSPRHT